MKHREINIFGNNLEFLKNIIIDNIPNTFIKKSKIHNFGLFSKINIKKGTILSILDGQILSIQEYKKLKNNICSKVDNSNKPEFENYIFMEYNYLDSENIIVRPFRTKYSYINHSDKANVSILRNPTRIYFY
ncbi:SET domain-containing protein-lysine N-methyltransferase [Campylobacter jejuni]|nr:SET domain-containing protein-lysine N-methyltransferase [Campylobacter jejuni]ECP7577833.1 hypothetical protein [Campylobacter jejuni]EEP3556530.1 hypothetical protein [Campylobacter jejuni]EGA8608692.1 hypothetical protein [Campylobacter jejuni]EGA8646412.1 hypothetical protein [Campylobacter jejuni]KAJ9816223.1 SET domain-containing protein [Campylobacter jejuni]